MWEKSPEFATGSATNVMADINKFLGGLPEAQAMSAKVVASDMSGKDARGIVFYHTEAPPTYDKAYLNPQGTFPSEGGDWSGVYFQVNTDYGSLYEQTVQYLNFLAKVESVQIALDTKVIYTNAKHVDAHMALFFPLSAPPKTPQSS